MTGPSKPSRYAGTNQPEHWEALYQQQDTAWDIGEPAPAFVDLLAADPPPPGRMIVLGAGAGHDALLFAQHGFAVLGVDFAPSAVERARTEAAARGLTGQATFEQRDIFALPPTYREAFDYVLEHTCLSALDPRLSDEYAALVTRLLRPGGMYLALFFTHGRPGGPPFTTSESEVRRLFTDRLTFRHLGPPGRSVPARAGNELFAVMTRGASP